MEQLAPPASVAPQALAPVVSAKSLGLAPMIDGVTPVIPVAEPLVSVALITALV